jgi:hypothetical protein
MQTADGAGNRVQKSWLNSFAQLGKIESEDKERPAIVRVFSF